MRSIVGFEYVNSHASASQIAPLDVRFQGLDRVICCWRVGDVLVDPGPESALPNLLAALGDVTPRALLLTHIHLDHAGASGALVARFPELEVWVHERGAPHVIDPSKLLASAGRLYGEQNMKPLWGEVLPVPAERVHALAGGETIPLQGGFRVAYTPGHASHHVCYLHEGSGRAFVGDMAGVRIPPAHVTVPPTPPPDIDVEAWDRSLDLLAEWRAASLGLTHFGGVDEVDEQLEAVRAALHHFADLTRSAGPETVGAAVRDLVDRTGDRELRARYASAVPPEHIYPGPRALLAQARRARSGREPVGVVARRHGGNLAGDDADDRAAARAGSGLRPGRALARDRPQRRPQHVRPRRPHARPLHPGRERRLRLRVRGPHPRDRPGDRLDRAEGTRRAVLGAAQRLRLDDGPARAGLSTFGRRDRPVARANQPLKSP